MFHSVFHLLGGHIEAESRNEPPQLSELVSSLWLGLRSCRSLDWLIAKRVPAGIEENRLAIHTAVPALHFQAELLHFVAVERATSFEVIDRQRKYALAHQLVKPCPAEANHASHLAD